MKLPEHVDKLRNLIESSFDKAFARLGIGKNKKMELEKLPEEVRSKRLRFEEMIENHIGETGNYENGREKLIDELTFTLFNRLAAVKVMEAAKMFPPILTKQPEHGDRSFGHKAWLEINPHMRSEELEGIREYIKFAFDDLGEIFPIYNRYYPYAMLPDAISLNEIIDAFNEIEKDPQIDKELWLSDDILGWLYESYNNEKKKAHKDSGDKTEYNKVSLQSQVYTPRWVVKFLVDNSLGKLYLEMYPDSGIKERFKIANAPKIRERTPKPLTEIKLIDPAPGSGNFLLYAFDLFYELYLDQIENYGADYDEKTIPKLIIKNNLHGIDIDDRAVQLAQLGLFIKAKKKKRNIGKLKFNIVSSDFYLPDYEQVAHILEESIDDELELIRPATQEDLIKDIWATLRDAYKYGSLIRVSEKIKSKVLKSTKKIDDEGYYQTDIFEEQTHQMHIDFSQTFLEKLKTAVERYAKAHGHSFLTSKTRDAITFLELLTTEYDVATANPPYTDSSDFGEDLKEFIENNYKKPYGFHTNLYATFIKRCYELTGSNGKVAMIHPHTFMFIKTFEDVRKFMIDKCHIDAMVDFGLDRVNLFGPGILLDATFYVLSKGKSKNDGLYFNLTTNLQEKYKKEKFLEALNDYVNGIVNDRVYTLEQSKLKIIKSWPFIYWISDEFREKFGGDSVEDYCKVAQGLITGHNERFLRFWWEIGSSASTHSTNKWVKYSKGGPFNKWYGNLWLTVNWADNGAEIKALKTDTGRQKSRTQNMNFYFKKGVTFSTTGSKGASFRELPEGCIFDGKGSSVFIQSKSLSNEYLLSYLNSKLSFYIANSLNSTVETTIGDVQRIPIIIPSEPIGKNFIVLSTKNMTIKKRLCAFSLIEPDYELSCLYNTLNVFILGDSIKSFLNYENHLLTQVLLNEAIINERIFEVYDLTKQDKAMVLAKEGESVGSLPVLAEAREAYLMNNEENKNFGMSDRSSECLSEKENLKGDNRSQGQETIAKVDEFPLSPEVVEFINQLPTKEFTFEEREAIESGFPTLYQNNNDLEEFCIRHQVNPINVWYWFKQSNVIPQQRMHTLAMEFLADMIREILMEDEDGIIPLVPNAGEKILLDRIEDKFREKGFSSAQYSSFDSVLGRPIQEYITKYFFKELSDHLNLFMYLPKTPFIWHLSSGSEQGFDCYIIIYKWSRDKLQKLRSVYIEHRERSLDNRQSDLRAKGQLSAAEQTESDTIFKQLQEIEEFKKKIDELLAEGYNPILDDGVGKNIAPLQKKKMIPYEVLNAGQLTKYLNADW